MARFVDKRYLGWAQPVGRYAAAGRSPDLWLGIPAGPVARKPRKLLITLQRSQSMNKVPYYLNQILMYGKVLSLKHEISELACGFGYLCRREMEITGIRCCCVTGAPWNSSPFTTPTRRCRPTRPSPSPSMGMCRVAPMKCSFAEMPSPFTWGRKCGCGAGSWCGQCYENMLSSTAPDRGWEPSSKERVAALRPGGPPQIQRRTGRMANRASASRVANDASP